MYGHFAEPNEYDLKAKEFCEKYGIKIQIHYCGRGHFPNYWGEDRYLHDTYNIKIFREGKESPSFKFYNSAVNTENEERPTEYDILCCLEKYDHGSFEEFCREFGYEQYNYDMTINRAAKRTYDACEKMYAWVSDIFEEGSECYDELCEIQ